MPLRPRLATLLLLAPLLALAADDAERTFTYSPEWVQVFASESSLTDLNGAFISGSRAALGRLIKTLATDRNAFRRMADLDDPVRARLVADLDRYDRSLEPIGDDPYHADALKLAEFFGVRRPEAVPLLLRAASDDRKSSQAIDRARRLADEAFARPTEAPGVLRALADAAATEGPELRAAALARLSTDDPAVRAALASAVARAAALGHFGAAKSLLDDRYVDFGTLVRAFTVALNSSVTATQRLRVLAAIDEADLVGRLRSDDALLPAIAALSGQVPTAGATEVDPRQLIAAAVVAVKVLEGLTPGADALAPFKADGRPLRDVLGPAMDSADKSARLAAIRTIQQLGPDVRTEFKPRLTALLADPDHDVRYLTAQCLGDERSLAVVRVHDLLADCRADSPTLRETAARQLHELDVFPKPVTAALLRAVAARDMAAREGFLRAMERAYAAQADPMLSLQSAADADDSATRAYARAALGALAPARKGE